jgi:hypothetical protein
MSDIADRKTYVNAHLLFRIKKTVIVDVILVNSVMWVEAWGRGERGES